MYTEQNLLRKENVHLIKPGETIYYQERKPDEPFSEFSSACCLVKIEDVRDRGDHLQLKITTVADTAIAPAGTTWNMYHYYSNPEPPVLLLNHPPTS